MFRVSNSLVDGLGFRIQGLWCRAQVFRCGGMKVGVDVFCFFES